MITDAFLKRIQQRLRDEYIIAQGDAIKQIVAQYAGAIEYINGVLTSNPSARAGDVQAALVAINNALDETTPSIQDKFRTELTSINRLGLQNLTVPLIAAGYEIPTNLGDKLSSLPAMIS